jgi:pimeloyl-ACP methyl ester carboxylesterase
MAPLLPRLTPQSVYLASSRTPAAYLIFFITGNPGCIGYYHSFLSLLSTALAPENVDVYGHSLANFVDETPSPQAEHSTRQVLGLQAQIDYVETLLDSYVSTDVLRRSGAKSPLKVILMGHSVGAYIGLEILRRWREKERKGMEKWRMQIVGYVGLWPTVTWIGRSPSGRKLGVSRHEIGVFKR